MQKPIPANATGVEVTLDAVDPNGNFIHLGTATSDMSGLLQLRVDDSRRSRQVHYHRYVRRL